MKKILNIFASISLITTGASSVVACGGSINNDQKLVDDIINRLEKHGTFGLNEKQDGSQVFSDYKVTVLEDIKSTLTEQEKGLVSFPASDNPKKLSAANATDIDVNIQSHDIQIPIKLNYDADSIADKINNQTIIKVLQTGGYKPSESASKYAQEIKKEINDLLTSDEQKSGYKISNLQQVLDNTNIYWPYLNKTIEEEVDPNQPIPLNIQIGEDKAKAKITLEFQYYKQKKELDDPRNGEKQNALPVHLGSHETIKPPWDEGIIKELDSDWESIGGLTTSLYSDVVYKPVTLRKDTPVLVKMYFKDGILGYTKNHPLSFYVEGN